MVCTFGVWANISGMINIDGIYVFICWSIVANIRWLILTMNTMKRICGPLGTGLEY
jgi:hypothetical protein